MRCFRFSIITKLAATFLVAALVPASVALILLEEQSAREIVAQTETHLGDLARDREHLLKSHVGALQNTASILATSGIVSDYLRQLKKNEGSNGGERSAGELTENLIHEAQERLWGDIHHIFLTDHRGQVIMSPPHGTYDTPFRSPATADEQLRNEIGTHLSDSLAKRGFFKEALEQPTVTSFFGFGERDHYHQLVMHPVKDGDGTALGIVVMEVDINSINALLSRGFDLGESGRVFLATNTGERVAEKKSEGRMHIDSQGLSLAMGSQESNFGDYLVDGEREVFGMYVPSNEHPWVVCIEVDREEVLRKASIHRSFMFKIIGLMSLALGIVGMLLGTWFGRPLKRCAAAARKISEGEIDSPIPITRGHDEIGTLERATESMRTKLCEQIKILDRHVGEKTQELSTALEDARLTHERFELAVRGSKDGIWDWDLEADRVYFAPRWLELLGLTADDIDDDPEAWMQLVVPSQRTEFELRLRQHIDGRTQQFDTEVEMLHADGSARWMLCRAAAIRDEHGRAIRLAGSLADITALKDAQHDLRQMANHDRLTGLPNREHFNDQLQHAIARAQRNPDNSFAVLFFDFDRFKVINDSLGHDIGDSLLVSIAQRFNIELREVDTAARFGGDEFVVILDGMKGIDAAQRVCDRLLSAFAKPHELNGRQVVSTASIGLVMYEPSYTQAEDMVRDADTAMYQAKTSGRAQYRIFDQAMHSSAMDRLNLEHDLRNADFDQELRLYYQSIISLDTGEIRGFEALVRWEHPRLGLVSPLSFIPIAEETGLIVPLGEWVLKTATRQLKRWQREFGLEGKLFMNVNLARRQLLHPSLEDTLKNLIGNFELEPGDLKLEITETTVMDERHDMVPAMEKIRQLGFPLAMDDFGTGHSSLSCLHSFPIDVLKIDRSFISPLGESSEFTAVVQAIITLAHHLELDVVAEGIESNEQLAQLQVLGCGFAQGFLFSKPVPAGEAGELLRSGLRRAA